ncbi:heparin lyase I family protein [Corallincola luteus]|nr:heparin lyase I family protein [Corallincola luteus]
MFSVLIMSILAGCTFNYTEYSLWAGDFSNAFPTLSSGRVHLECWHGDALIGQAPGQAGFTLGANQGKRCEVAVHDLLERDRPFSLSFKFKTAAENSSDHYWHSYFQVHSFPDEGEQWRCPIMALEALQGELRMFNRSDKEAIAHLPNGTCAGEGNSISSRTLFENLPLTPEVWHEFRMSGVLSTSDSACLTVEIDGYVVSAECGANTFNDKSSPFLKFGIYNPTGWNGISTLSIEYKDIYFSNDVEL